MGDGLPEGGLRGAMSAGMVPVVLAIVMGIALIMAMTRSDFGAGDHGRSMLVQQIESDLRADVNEAQTYAQLRDNPRGESSGWVEDREALNAAMPNVLDAVELGGTSKGSVLGQRANRRAYDGAPPTIPHMIRQDSAPECLNCHGQGLQLGDRQAPVLPHKTFTSCTQCHVTAVTPMPGGYELEPDPRGVDNSFVGRTAPVQGPRAWSVAPPTIPHRVFMHENCHSCHGVNGRDAIRSSHPWRQNCEQCHAPAAELDQRLFMGVP